MKRKRFAIGCLIVGGVLALFVLTPLVLLCLPVMQNEMQIRKMKCAMKQAAVYEPVGRKLALYCQSDLSLFPEYLDYAWLPNELTDIGGGWGTVSSNHAHVEMGGGFHHFGYHLERDDQVSTPETNVWQLFLYDEGSREKHLQTIKLARTDHLSPEEVLAGVSSGLDEQLRKNPKAQYAYQAKIQIYLRFGHVAEARQVCKDMLKSMPDDWWAILINSFLLEEEGPYDQAENLIIQWVKKDENFFRYLDLAYFYHLTNRPRKAAEAIIKATAFDANTNWGERGNSEFRGYTAAMCAYRAGDYDATIRLCEHLLPVKINGNYAKAGLTDLKEAAQKAKQGQMADVKWSKNIGPFDAFEKMDIEKLLGHNVPRPIDEEAAERERTKERTNHYQLISSLVRKKQFETAANECKKGLEESPNSWWLNVAKALICAELKDSGSEESFVKWVNANPNFFNYYHLAFYWRSQNLSDKALGALREAAKYEITTPEDCLTMHWFYGQEAAYYAYRQKDYPLAIALCNRVEQLPKSYDDMGYAVHAASLLANGEILAAKEYAQKICQLNDWQRIEYRSLLDAIQKSDSSFIFELSNNYSAYSFWELEN
jgi:Flp pilus assembly protein TadD